MLISKTSLVFVVMVWIAEAAMVDKCKTDMGVCLHEPKSVITPSPNPPACSFTVRNQSARYWKGRIVYENPSFVRIKLKLPKNKEYVVEENILKPLHWVWTYTSDTEDSAFLYWPLDYSILSFGLLDTRTLDIDDMELDLAPGADNCSIRFGAKDTTESIAKTLAVGLLSKKDIEFPRYKSVNFCYHHYRSIDRTSFEYFMALYFRYPLSVSSKTYRCCKLKYCFSFEEYIAAEHMEVETWKVFIVGPYAIGLILFLYFPILLFQIMTWFAKDQTIEMENYVQLENEYQFTENAVSNVTEWLYLDGSPPLTFSDIFRSKYLRKRFPVAMSRMSRLFMLIFIPLTMLAQLLLYRNGIDRKGKISIEDLNTIGDPSSFLGLLAKKSYKTFVPAFGGPIGVLVLYFVLGFILVMCPESLKLVVENGMPRYRSVSPLFLGVQEISEIASMSIHAEPGFAKAAVVWKCSMFMVFRPKAFWYSQVFSVQRNRFKWLGLSDLNFCIKIVLFNLLLLGSLFEMCLCILLYAFPLSGALTVIMKGAVVSISNMKINNRRLRKVLHTRCATFIISIIVVNLSILFAYTLALIFLQNFMFISQVLLFNLVAIFTYPSVAFGYTFFVLVTVYYILNLLKEFREGYLGLLCTATEISVQKAEQGKNFVVLKDNSVHVWVVRTAFLNKVYLNGKILQIPENTLQELNAPSADLMKVPKLRNAYGIPKELFDLLVMRYRPVYVETLKIAFRVIGLSCFVMFALWVTSNHSSPSSEISDVMHVVFIVVLGALPRLVETAFANNSEFVEQDIERRDIEETINEFWREKEKTLVSPGIINEDLSYQDIVLTGSYA